MNEDEATCKALDAIWPHDGPWHVAARSRAPALAPVLFRAQIGGTVVIRTNTGWQAVFGSGYASGPTPEAALVAMKAKRVEALRLEAERLGFAVVESPVAGHARLCDEPHDPVEGREPA